MQQAELFGAAAALPAGLLYEPEFITRAEESSLLEAIRSLPLSEARYRQYTARRRTASFGYEYDFDTGRRKPAQPMPDFLFPIRDRAARWANVPAERFAQALVTEYRTGSALGWHRDVPDFDVVFGLSLAGACRLRLRPHPGATGRPAPRGSPARPEPDVWRKRPLELLLEPRSAYLLRDAVRWGWQHGIPSTKVLRYSVTLRTLRHGSPSLRGFP